MKKELNVIRICNFILIALMLAMLICQFLPFWSVADKQVSVQEYNWITWEHADLTKQIQKELGKDFMVKDFALIPFSVFFGSILGTIFTLLHLKSAGISLVGFSVGIICTIGYLTTPVMQLGSMWILHLVVSILLVLAGLPAFVILIKRAINWFKVPQEA